MKITVERAALLKSLGHVRRVVESRTTIPILANVHIGAGDGKVTFRATDLDIEVSDTVDATCTAGATSVGAALLHDIVRRLPDGCQVVMELADDGNQLVVRAGRSRFKLPTLPPADFPSLEIGDMTHEFELSAADINALFGRTRFAISTEETRYYLNGIYLHVLDAGSNRPLLAGVATDGHRLAKVTIDLPGEAKGMPSVIVPRKTVAELVKLVDVSEKVGVRLSSAKIEFTFGDVVLRSKLIDGTYPDYGRVIPDGNGRVLTVDRAELGACVGRVSAVSEKGRAIKVAVTKNGAELSVTNADVGSATEEVEAAYDAEPLDIGFNGRYLADLISEVRTDRIEIAMDEPGSPTLFRGVGDDSALYVLMPMRL